MFHLHHLQASFNSKVTETKEAADLLAKYTKKATSSFSVNNVAIVDAIVATFVPVVDQPLGTNNRPKGKCTQSVRALEAVFLGLIKIIY